MRDFIISLVMLIAFFCSVIGVAGMLVILATQKVSKKDFIISKEVIEAKMVRYTLRFVGVMLAVLYEAVTAFNY